MLEKQCKVDTVVRFRTNLKQLISHVHINIVIFQSLLMVFNRDMQDMCSCKQNHVLFIACNHGNWNGLYDCIHDSILTPLDSVVIGN